jgi:hypothetical protein
LTFGGGIFGGAGASNRAANSAWVGATKNHSLALRTNNNDNLVISAAGNVGIGTTSPAAMLSVGSSSQFQVSSGGNLTKVNNVTYSWPSAQGSSNEVLTNDGSGNLTWAAATPSGKTSCPTGFTLVGGAGKVGNFCIDTNARTATTWMAAKDICDNLTITGAEAMMCSHNQWHKACNKGAMTGWSGHYEFVGDLVDNAWVMMAGNTGCSGWSYTNYSTAVAYRCCIQ